MRICGCWRQRVKRIEARAVRWMAVGTVVWSCTGVVAVANGEARAEPTTDPTVGGPTAGPLISADAEKLLGQVRDAYGNLRGLEMAGTMTMSATGLEDKPQTIASGFNAVYAAPVFFRNSTGDSSTDSGAGDSMVLANTAKKLYVYRPRNNDVVSVDPIVARTAGDKLNPSLRALLAEQNPSLLLAIVPDASAELTAGALRVTTQSTGELAGCVGLRIERADENLNAAFDATTHLLRQMRVDLTPGLRGADFPKGGHVELRFDYTRDEAQKQIAASEVAWSPPAEAQAYRPAPSVETGDGSEAASKLEGNPAPAFSLKDAENKRVSLADFKGSVVVLDFWAVWCGPCRAALPHLDQLSKQKAGAGVKVLAIDEQDAPEAAMAYVSQAKLGLHVAFDADGAVGKTYMVEGIPETVVIGKDGVVRKVVVGYGPGDDRVEKAVDNALAE